MTARIEPPQTVEKPEIQENWISGFDINTNKSEKHNNAEE